jgi:WD40 repeat protein
VQAINAVSIRQQRPYRAVTASDDCSIVFFTGVPFKSDKVRLFSPSNSVLISRRSEEYYADDSNLGVQVIRTHTRFVQDVRYSPNGDHFVSVGSDGKMFLYDGKEGSTVGEVEASRGSVVSLSKRMARDSGGRSMDVDVYLGVIVVYAV